MGGYPTAPVVPVILALGELLKIRGRDFLQANMVGVQVQGVSLASEEVLAQGYRRTSTFGIFGAVAAASKLLDLDFEKIETAYGAMRASSGAQAWALYSNLVSS